MVALSDAYDGPAWACGCADTWNLTDWFESIYIHQHGVEMYDQLFGGELPFTDQSVKDAIDQTFAEDNEAWLFYEGGFVAGLAVGQNPGLEEELGTRIDFFDFPPVGEGGGSPITIGGDVIAAFVNDSDVAAFMEY